VADHERPGVVIGSGARSGAPGGGSRAARLGARGTWRTAAIDDSVRRLVAERRVTLGRPLHVLDLGGGTGGTAVPLAREGHRVTVVDPSLDALASLRRRVAEAGVHERVRAVQGDTDSIGAGSPSSASGPFDLVCLHGTLEVVDDPGSALGNVAGVLAVGGILSLVVAQRLHGVLTRALAGEFERARAILERPDGRWGDDDPAPRRFDEHVVLALVREHGLTPTGVRGMRVFADLVPAALIDSDAARAALLALEDAATSDDAHAVLSSLGGVLHVVARKG
jgi:S-adenosylmethionine-dependent methyltransferase